MALGRWSAAWQSTPPSPPPTPTAARAAPRAPWPRATGSRVRPTLWMRKARLPEGRSLHKVTISNGRSHTLPIRTWLSGHALGRGHRVRSQNSACPRLHWALRRSSENPDRIPPELKAKKWPLPPFQGTQVPSSGQAWGSFLVGWGQSVFKVKGQHSLPPTQGAGLERGPELGTYL